jgi:hypothetical protein
MITIVWKVKVAVGVGVGIIFSFEEIHETSFE